MLFQDLISTQKIVMQQIDDVIRFVHVDKPQYTLMVQFPTIKYVSPKDGYVEFNFHESFQTHFEQFQNNIGTFLKHEFDLEYRPSVRRFRYDPDVCVFFFMSPNVHDDTLSPEGRYTTPMVAIHGLVLDPQGGMKLDMQVVQFQCFDKVPILPDLSVPMFKTN